MMGVKAYSGEEKAGGTIGAAAKKEEQRQETEREQEERQLREVIEEKRRKRKPLGRRRRLQFPDRPGYHRHVFNDKDGRIQEQLDGGYDLVLEKDIDGGDLRFGADRQLGSPVSRSVGNDTKGVLMEIPQELYDEDQKAKTKKIDKEEREALMPFSNQADKDDSYGNIKIEVEK